MVSGGVLCVKIQEAEAASSKQSQMETSNSWVQHQWFLGFFPRIFFISKSYPRQWKKALVFELYEMTSMTCINFPRKTSFVWYFMGVSWSHQVVFIQIRSLPTCRWKKPVAPVEVGSVIVYQVFAPSQMFVLDIWTIHRSPNLCIRGFPNWGSSMAQVDVVKMGRTQLQDAVPMPLGITWNDSWVEDAKSRWWWFRVISHSQGPPAWPFGWWC